MNTMLKPTKAELTSSIKPSANDPVPYCQQLWLLEGGRRPVLRGAELMWGLPGRASLSLAEIFPLMRPFNLAL